MTKPGSPVFLIHSGWCPGTGAKPSRAAECLMTACQRCPRRCWQLRFKVLFPNLLKKPYRQGTWWAYCCSWWLVEVARLLPTPWWHGPCLAICMVATGVCQPGFELLLVQQVFIFNALLACWYSWRGRQIAMKEVFFLQGSVRTARCRRSCRCADSSILGRRWSFLVLRFRRRCGLLKDPRLLADKPKIVNKAMMRNGFRKSKEVGSQRQSGVSKLAARWKPDGLAMPSVMTSTCTLPPCIPTGCLG